MAKHAQTHGHTPQTLEFEPASLLDSILESSDTPLLDSILTETTTVTIAQTRTVQTTVSVRTDKTVIRYADGTWVIVPKPKTFPDGAHSVISFRCGCGCDPVCSYCWEDGTVQVVRLEVPHA